MRVLYVNTVTRAAVEGYNKRINNLAKTVYYNYGTSAFHLNNTL